MLAWTLSARLSGNETPRIRTMFFHPNFVSETKEVVVPFIHVFVSKTFLVTVKKLS